MTAATLQMLLDEGIGLRCWCAKCSKSWVMDAAYLSRALGPATPIQNVPEEIICTKCGNVQVEVQPDWQGPGVIVKAVP